MKECPKCLVLKQTNLFYKDKSKKDGLTSYCKPCQKASSTHRVQNNYEEVKVYKQEHYKKNRIKIRLKQKEYFQLNKEKVTKNNKLYVDNNRESYKKWRREYKKERLQEPLFKLKENLRRRLNHSLKSKNWNKTTSFSEYIGCSQNELLKHIETQFKPGMTWKNYGYYGWHIDHIIPLASAKTEEKMYQLCRYTNLQPLWAIENLRKNDSCLR